MTPRRFPLRCLAVLLSAVLMLISSPLGAAAPTAALSGRIMARSGQTLEGTVRLHAGDAKTGAVYSSEPLGTDGTFEIRNLPASSYRLAVEADGGLYVVETPIRLDAGANRTVQLAIQAQAATATGRLNAAEKKPGAASFWENPLTATLIVIGGAILVGIIVDEATDEDNASPSSP